MHLRTIFLFLLTGVVLFATPTITSAALASPFEAQAIEAFEKAQDNERPIKAARYLGGVTPHHDLAFDMIARFYTRIAAGNAAKVRRVWLFSPDHFRRARRWAVICNADWRFTSPRLASRTLAADREACEALTGMNIVEANPEMFSFEHGITLHIPLIAQAFPNATVVPMVLNPGISDLALLMLRKKIFSLLNDGDIILLSMDLSHYKTPEGMAAEDVKTLKVLTEMMPRDTAKIDVDARRAATLVLWLFKDMGVQLAEVLERCDSSDLLGFRVESGTSYATVVYVGDGF